MRRRILIGCFVSIVALAALLGLFVLYLLTCTTVGEQVAYEINPAPFHQARIQQWQPVVDAIERYRQQNGSPPAQLSDLAPKYLPAAKLPPAIWYPPPYEHSGHSFTFNIFAGGWKDCLTYVSDDRAWYYTDDGGGPSRRITVKSSGR